MKIVEMVGTKVNRGELESESESKSKRARRFYFDDNGISEASHLKLLMLEKIIDNTSTVLCKYYYALLNADKYRILYWKLLRGALPIFSSTGEEVF